MDRLDEFLKTFYEAISFKSVKEFDSERFRSLFTLNAQLAERARESLCSDDIDNYVKVFLDESKELPEHCDYSLQEVQTGYEHLSGEDFVLVKSEYDKRITKTTPEGTQESLTHDCNFMTLCHDGDWFKIHSIVWTAQV
jgi:poly-D-alanine transfer protein DltD